MLTKLYKKAPCLCAAGITAAAFLMSQVILGVIGGDMTLFYGDLFIQYIPFIKMFLRALKGQESFWYSFSIYLGSGTALTYTYYTLSPFNLLYLIEAVSIHDMTLIIITLKLSLAAAAFSFFARRSLGLSGHTALLFAPAYALSTFSAAFFIHIMWLDALYMLPVLVHFTLKEAKGSAEKKDHLILTLSFAYLFITNFYIAFMAGVFIAFVFLGAAINDAIETKNGRIIINRGFSFAFTVLLAVGLCACMLLPAGLFLYRNAAPDNFEFRALKVTLADILKRFFIGEMHDLDNTSPFLYCSIPALLLLPFFFILKEIPLRKRLISGVIILFYLLSMFLLPLYKFMHAFDYPNYYAFRFSFCLIFLIVSLSAVCFEKYKNSGIFIWGLILSVFYTIMMRIEPQYIAASDQVSSPRVTLLNITAIILWCLLFMAGRIKKTRMLKIFTILLMLAELTVNLGITVKNRGSIIEKKQADLEYATREVIFDDHKNPDYSPASNEFSRISADHEPLYNAPSQFGFGGLNTFSSSDDYELRKLLHNLGVAAPNRVIYEQGYTPVTYALFDTGYFIDFPQTIEGEPSPEELAKKIAVIPAEYSVPLIFMASGKSLEYASTENPFINQNEIFSSLTGETVSFYTHVSSDDISILSFNAAADVDIEDMKFFYRKNNAIGDAALQYKINDKNGNDIYACFTEKDCILSLRTPALTGETYGAAHVQRMSQGTLLKASTEDSAKTIRIRWAEDSSDYCCKDIYFFEYTGEEALKTACKNLSNNGINITEFNSDHIKGKIHADEAFPVFMTTIPYDTDWHIYVDGKEADTSALLEEAFLGLEHLDPGEHEIELRYIPSGFKEGLIISILALLLIIVRYIIYNCKKKAKL
ncbi:MAG: YfhO family protein [Lachnospiraceae bacterium]|nr:YfhO family protein [Lachnospiraceae bacterium]